MSLALGSWEIQKIAAKREVEIPDPLYDILPLRHKVHETVVKIVFLVVVNSVSIFFKSFTFFVTDNSESTFGGIALAPAIPQSQHTGPVPDKLHIHECLDSLGSPDIVFVSF